jgi:hypothetical protein
MSRIITLLFHPFSFLFLGVLILFNTNTYINFSYPDSLKLMVYLVLFVNTMILPVVFAWYLASKGHITSIAMDDISDRKLIYFFSFILYLATLFVLSGFNVPGVIYKYAFGATLTVGCMFVFALARKKLSAHLSALGGLCGALIMISIKIHTDFLALICVLVLLSGIVGMARIQLNAHKENEIYWGFLIGFFAQIFVFN